MALAILADANIQGQVFRIVQEMENGEWSELWASLDIGFTTFARIGIPTELPDQDLWHLCQRDGYLLITANRNGHGPNSLDAVIRSDGQPESLPVFTIGSVDRLMKSRDYAEAVMLKLLDHLQLLDNLRGGGRIYLP